jgi:predicted MFS family arabinose efflux permease
MKFRREVILLSLLFATLYIVQGFAEPSEGLIAQPVRAQLRFLEVPPSEIGYFSFLIGLPWSFKLLFGLTSDFVPIFGSRRKSYLLLATLLTAVSLFAVALIPFELNRQKVIFWFVCAASIGVAFTDVVVDALAVIAGQKYGLTGRFQAIQWGGIYTATILTGSTGGWLSQHHLPWIGFMICGSLAVVSLVMTQLVVNESRDRTSSLGALRSLESTLKSPLVWTVGAFLFLWNFNPFSSVVLEDYVTKQLHLSEQFVGHTRSLAGFGSIFSCAAYAVWGPRIPVRWLIHGSILAGVLSSLVYLLMWNEWSGLAVSLLAGAFYMLGTLVQLDLAARACKPESAGTTFAALMALSNTGLSLGILFGGNWYEWLAQRMESNHLAFILLVVIGSLTTAACWLLVPAMTWARRSSEPPHKDSCAAA